MAVRRKLVHFWQQRNSAESVLLDKFSINNASFAVAWLAYVFKVTPNQLSVASGVFSLCAFVIALGWPAAELTAPLLWIFACAQTAYLLDCADGQLARATGQASEFGDLLDHGIDVGASTLVFGGVFAFLYRHFSAAGAPETADLSLLVGFLFLLARSVRFFAWQKFSYLYGDKEKGVRREPSATHHILVSLMDHQMSLFGIILFLTMPAVGFMLFVGQAILLGTAYLRYFVRAWRIHKDSLPGED